MLDYPQEEMNWYLFECKSEEDEYTPQLELSDTAHQIPPVLLFPCYFNKFLKRLDITENAYVIHLGLAVI